MSIAQAHTVALHGIDGTMAVVTADIGSSLAAPHPPPDARETRDRVRAAIRNSDLPWTTHSVAIRLPAPHRYSSSMDLATACALLAADGQVETDTLDRVLLVGELALDGHLRPVRGLLPILLAARRARRDKIAVIDTVIVPTDMLDEAAVLPGIRVLGATRLAEVVSWLRGERVLAASPSRGAATTAAWLDASGPSDEPGAGVHDNVGLGQPDVADLWCQPEAIRALEVAAAGGHHLLLAGLPGAGASMLARCLPGLLPPLTDEQALEVTAIHSIAGLLTAGCSLITTPPFIAPHHSTSLAALVGGGGGGLAKPGAVSQAHHGILYLDEVGEFAPNRLDAVRTALEEGEVRLARRDGVARYPARFQLVLASAPCPCRQAEQDCVCSQHAKRRFRARITGPLLDRVDLRVRLDPPVDSAPDAFASDASAPEVGAIARARVREARSRAAQRWSAHGGSTNADVPRAAFTRLEFRLPRSVTAPVDRALEMGAVSGRGWVRTLRVAWTLADLAGLARPGRDEITEALEFRDRRTV